MFFQTLPVDAGALDAEQDAQVDWGPAGVGLAAVTALLVPRQTLDALQDGFPSDAALPRLTGRINAAGGRRGCSVQMLHITNTQKKSHLLESQNTWWTGVSAYNISVGGFFTDDTIKSDKQAITLYLYL